MAYQHGVYVTENPTKIISPIVADSGIQIVVGTAPINLGELKTALIPKIAYSYSEAVKKIGYSNNFSDFTLCQSIKATFEIYNVAPIIFINVLDPNEHVKNVDAETITFTLGKTTVAKEGILLDTLVIESTDGLTTYIKGEDYTAQYDKNGYLNIVKSPTAAEEFTGGKISYIQLDPSMVTEDDIIAGIEKIVEVFPRYNVIPGLLVVPEWSKKPKVYNAMTAKTTNLNGSFSCMAIADIDTAIAKSYDMVLAEKNKHNYTDKNSILVWPNCRVNDKIYSMSAITAAHISYVDAQNDNVPAVSPSNKPFKISGICLEDGTEVIIDQQIGNYLNGQGICTTINVSGWKFWGNNTAAYQQQPSPNISSSDPKDRYIPVRRMFIWWGNSLILTYFRKVDDPTNRRMIESIVDSENIRANSFKSRGYIADAYIEFTQADNSLEQLLNGNIHFKLYLTPYLPAEAIVFDLEFSPTALQNALFTE